MKATRIDFPNPVLAAGRDDYISTCYFYTVFNEEKIEITADNIIISFSYYLSCSGLETLIKNGRAVAVLSVRSSAGSFSRLFEFELGKSNVTVSIPKFEVVERIEVYGAIIATEAIPEFSCPGEFNDLYFSDLTFEVRKGDILAREDIRIIYLDDSELEKPISSIFLINKIPEQNDDVIPDFDSEKILINLKEPLFNIYYELSGFSNGALRRYVMGVIVYPVLIEAIEKIRDTYNKGEVGEDYSGKRWFRAIENKAEKVGINMEFYIDSSVTLADKLLGEITHSALKSFKETLDSEMHTGESFLMGGID